MPGMYGENITMLADLREAIKRATSGYIKSMPICSYRAGNSVVSLDTRDLLLIGAVTESDILLTGKTGSGKTMLANGVMKGLFGADGYYAKTTLPAMNPSEFMDIDFPAIMEGRKTLKEAVSGITSLNKPGLVLNEVNRAPSLIQSILISILDNELEVQGVPVEMGRRWNQGSYHFRILTINEGDAYQVQSLDPAIRDRMIIEIPVDAFPQSRFDIYSMLQKSSVCDKVSFTPEESGKEDLFDEVVQLKTVLEKIPMHKKSIFFLGYLSGLSYCIRAPLGNKESIILTPEVCEGWHHMAMFYNLCGNIMAPSARILVRLQRLAKAFALFRAWYTRQTENLMVLPEDIIEAAPFVLYSKLSLNPMWVRTAGDRTHQLWGDRWTAIKEILNWIFHKRFPELISPDSSIGELIYMASMGKTRAKRDWERIHRYLVETDPWAFDPAVVRRNLI